MTLREEILNEAVLKDRTEAVMRAEEVLDVLIKYFNSIGRADAANVLRNLKNRQSSTKINYLNKMADMVRQYRNEIK